MRINIGGYIMAFCVILFIAGCSSSRRLSDIRERQVGVAISLPLSRIDESSFRDYSVGDIKNNDTITVNIDGHEMVIMNAILDEESGEMVAHQELQAAFVTARFRNIAERHGLIDLEFEIRVPQELISQAWQLRFYPEMYMMGDTTMLEKVILTGEGYRRDQMKGYERYNQFLNKIISDSTKFIDIRDLEIFLKRNIPHIYFFKTDSSVVSKTQFESYFGVSEKMAVEHYTNKFSKNMNERRKERRSKMYRKYVKSPIITEGVRLDTIITSADGDFIYNYVQTVKTRKGLRKIDISLSGEIFESDKRLYTIPKTEPLTFYISSLSSLTDKTPRYLTRIIERQASANASWNIDFKVGKYDIDPELGKNKVQINNIKENLNSLMDNEEFVLDSITIAAFASPEGSMTSNRLLSSRRAKGTADYFRSYVKARQDSIKAEAGMSIVVGEDMSESAMAETEVKNDEILFLTRNGGENWDMLSLLVEECDFMNEKEKEHFRNSMKIDHLDMRESSIRSEKYYKEMRNSLYPRLRNVRFDFFLHRKGMIKDTVHTTVLDTTYMKGVQFLEDRDYDSALALLAPYEDYNTAIALVSLDRNRSALRILKDMKSLPSVNYMLAVIYSRLADDKNAVEKYLTACKQDPSYVHRGNLDPEIAALIKKYNLNAQPEDEFDYGL